MTIVALMAVAFLAPASSAHTYADRHLDFLTSRTGSWRSIGSHEDYAHTITGASNKGYMVRIKVEVQYRDLDTGEYSKWYPKGYCPVRNDASYHCTYRGRMQQKWDQQRTRYSGENGNAVFFWGDVDFRFRN